MSSFIRTRYPYTYSADAIRGLTSELVLSRGDAAHILSAFCDITGVSRQEAACDFADTYIAKFHPECADEAASARKEELGE